MTEKPFIRIQEALPPVNYGLSFPRGFPDAFQASFENSGTIGTWATPSEAQQLLDSVHLRDFWGQMSESVAAHPAPALLPWTAQQRRYAFMNGVLHHLFEPRIADGQTADRRSKQRKRIAKAARVLELELKRDKSGLLSQFLLHLEGKRKKDVRYVCGNRGNVGGIFKDESQRNHMYIYRLPRELRELAEFAENAVVTPRPHEPGNPGAKNGHLYQKAIGLWWNFVTWTGKDQDKWIETLLFVATGKRTYRLMENIKKHNPHPTLDNR